MLDPSSARGWAVDIIALLSSRRSIRRYEDRPVPEVTLRLMLDAAMAPPNACNRQPWEFVVLTWPEVLDRLRGRLMFARYNAPAAIVV